MEPTSGVTDGFHFMDKDESVDDVLQHLHDKVAAISKLAAENRTSDFIPKAKPGWFGWAFSYVYRPKQEVEMPVDLQIQSMGVDLLSIIAEAESLSGNSLEEYKKVLANTQFAQGELLKLLGPDRFIDNIRKALEQENSTEGLERLEKFEYNLHKYIIAALEVKIDRFSRRMLSAAQGENSATSSFLAESSIQPLRVSDSSSEEHSALSSLRVSEDSSNDPMPSPTSDDSAVPPPPPPPFGVGAPPPPPPPGLKQAAKPKVDPEVAHLNREKQRLEKELLKRSDPASWIYLEPPSDKKKAVLEIQKDAYEKAKKAMGTQDTSSIDQLIDDVRSQMDGKLATIGPNNLGEIIRNLSKLRSEELRILMHFASSVISKRYSDGKLPDKFFDTKIQKDFYPENEKTVDLLRSSQEESPQAFFKKEEEWLQYIEKSLLADIVYKESFSLIRDRMRNPAKEPKYAIKPFKGSGKSEESENDSIARSEILSGILSQPKLRSTPTVAKKINENPLTALRANLKASRKPVEGEVDNSSSSSSSLQSRLRSTGADEERLAKLKLNETHEFYRLKFLELSRKIAALRLEKSELEELIQTESSSLTAAVLEKTQKRLEELNIAIEDFRNGEVALRKGFEIESGTDEGARVQAFIKKMSSITTLEGENELEKYLERAMKKYER